MTSLIANWIHSHLDYIKGAVLGLAVITLDIPETILKLILAILFGFLGGLGSWLWKKLQKKISKDE